MFTGFTDDNKEWLTPKQKGKNRPKKESDSDSGQDDSSDEEQENGTDEEQDSGAADKPQAKSTKEQYKVVFLFNTTIQSHKTSFINYLFYQLWLLFSLT